MKSRFLTFIVSIAMLINVQTSHVFADRTKLHDLIIPNRACYVSWFRECCIEHPEWINEKDNQGQTPLHKAAGLSISYNSGFARILIENGADVNCQDKLGRTPLHIAVICKSLEIINMLLDHGADVHCKDNEGMTPLDLANRSGCTEVLYEFVTYEDEILLDLEKHEKSKKSSPKEARGRLTCIII